MDLLGRTQPKPPVARPPNIRVHVSLDQPNVNFNFAALAEEKYGWNALHPVAARLRAINRLDSDEESDSEAQPGDVVAQSGGQASGTPAHGVGSQPARKRRKRRKDVEFYDISDPFIDDDELVLQERTAASKDGFFVFQGPLVAEGETVRIEKIDGTQKRAGGGKGSRGGKGARSKIGSGPPRPLGRPPKIKKDAQNVVQDTPTTKPDKGKSKVMVPSPVQPKSGKEVENEINLTESNDRNLPIVHDTLPPKQIGHRICGTMLSFVDAAQPVVPNVLVLPPSSDLQPAQSYPTLSPSSQSPKRKASSLMETPKPKKVYKKRNTSESAQAKRAQKALERTLDKLKYITSARSPGSQASPAPPIAQEPDTPSAQSDGSNKKPKKPVREKTSEEKAELARKARETRERKKQEKIAQERANKIALLARAIANPHVDTRGLTLPDLQSPKVLYHGNTQKIEKQQIKSELLSSGQSLAPPSDNARATNTLERDTHSPVPPKPSELDRISSPSGRSMSVNALLE